MATPGTYTVKPGDTLNGIAKNLGYKDYSAAGISGYGADPNKIKVGQVLTLGGATPPASRTEQIPGVGTLTVASKNPPAAAAPDPRAGLDGLYTRLGIAAPPSYAAPTTPGVPGLPSYPGGARAAREMAILKPYDDLLGSLSDIEKRFTGAQGMSDEEKQLAGDVIKAKSGLGAFDRGVLERVEGLYGQGRGATLGTIQLREDKERRTSALERLGLAQDVDTLVAQLGLAKEERLGQGQIAQAQYNMATKRLDYALGIQDRINTLADDERDNARQYLLDVVSFSGGKTYEQLDAPTQTAITEAVANTPITLDMVRSALTSSAEKARAAAAGELRSVEGIGVVQIDPVSGRWKVVVPENPGGGGDPGSGPGSTPTVAWETYLEQQNIPLPSLTQAKLTELRLEYDQKYNNTPVSLGKLSPDQKSEIQQAGLGGATGAVQSYFLNTPAEFQDEWQRDKAAGKVSGAPDLASMIDRYESWHAKQGKGGTRDWSTLLGQ